MIPPIIKLQLFILNMAHPFVKLLCSMKITYQILCAMSNQHPRLATFSSIVGNLEFAPIKLSSSVKHASQPLQCTSVMAQRICLVLFLYLNVSADKLCIEFVDQLSVWEKAACYATDCDGYSGWFGVGVDADEGSVEYVASDMFVDVFVAVSCVHGYLCATHGMAH